MDSRKRKEPAVSEKKNEEEQPTKKRLLENNKVEKITTASPLSEEKKEDDTLHSYHHSLFGSQLSENGFNPKHSPLFATFASMQQAAYHTKKMPNKESHALPWTYHTIELQIEFTMGKFFSYMPDPEQLEDKNYKIPQAYAFIRVFEKAVIDECKSSEKNLTAPYVLEIGLDAVNSNFSELLAVNKGQYLNGKQLFGLFNELRPHIKTDIMYYQDNSVVHSTWNEKEVMYVLRVAYAIAYGQTWEQMYLKDSYLLDVNNAKNGWEIKGGHSCTIFQSSDKYAQAISLLQSTTVNDWMTLQVLKDPDGLIQARLTEKYNDDKTVMLQIVVKNILEELRTSNDKARLTATLDVLLKMTATQKNINWYDNNGGEFKAIKSRQKPILKALSILYEGRFFCLHNAYKQKESKNTMSDLLSSSSSSSSDTNEKNSGTNSKKSI